ncbi:hypothetical protein MPTK1_2g04760 [Marchantia polymorpha subsp. ruderalis]|uniref:Uncharacterized protein n=1 Tax=Marchantia polymorpha TaxID=3197 RepID=A0A2R6X7T3_MARPO|nr:hypothetical protein MARPO_0031s0131 [Marchantia polymorpha]BBN01115.1 hypothetical protein Mp_2g04760 [Marchantia polymorpha subsp. ruderalis]|eukprot:PTQ42164.1 hypothetical protein MARPO_0031s0131 [Marchantia polymorpha]
MPLHSFDRSRVAHAAHRRAAIATFIEFRPSRLSPGPSASASAVVSRRSEIPSLSPSLPPSVTEKIATLRRRGCQSAIRRRDASNIPRAAAAPASASSRQREIPAPPGGRSTASVSAPARQLAGPYARHLRKNGASPRGGAIFEGRRRAAANA